MSLFRRRRRSTELTAPARPSLTGIDPDHRMFRICDVCQQPLGSEPQPDTRLRSMRVRSARRRSRVAGVRLQRASAPVHVLSRRRAAERLALVRVVLSAVQGPRAPVQRQAWAHGDPDRASPLMAGIGIRGVELSEADGAEVDRWLPASLAGHSGSSRRWTGSGTLPNGARSRCDPRFTMVGTTDLGSISGSPGHATRGLVTPASVWTPHSASWSRA